VRLREQRPASITGWRAEESSAAAASIDFASGMGGAGGA